MRAGRSSKPLPLTENDKTKLEMIARRPKTDQRTALRAGRQQSKLLIALLTEKMQCHAASLSHWGGRWLDQDPPPESLA